MNVQRPVRMQHIAAGTLVVFLGVAFAWADPREKKDVGARSKEDASAVDVLSANRLHERFDCFCRAASGVRVQYSGPLGGHRGGLGLGSMASNTNVLAWSIVYKPKPDPERGVLLATITVSATETGDISRTVSIGGRKMFINVSGEAETLDRPLSEHVRATGRDVIKRLSDLKDEELQL